MCGNRFGVSRVHGLSPHIIPAGGNSQQEHNENMDFINTKQIFIFPESVVNVLMKNSKTETVGWFSLSYHRSQNLDGDSSQTRPPSQGPPQLGIEEGVVLVWQHSLAQWLSCLSPFLKILSSKTHNYWFSPMVKRSGAKESQNQQVLNIHVKEKLKVKHIMSTLESEVLVFP